ncbi:MAG: acyltransferase [Clostridia bacterium]|nr:acyltransferase [Clostridia bacterium]
MLKRMIRSLILREKADSDAYIKYLRKKGMRIGERTVVYEPRSVVIDVTRPWMIEMGDDVKITHGVIILTHGFDWSVLKGAYGDVLGSSGKVTVGNNVFIGMNSIILKGVTVGNNVIIGAGSLVNKDVPDNCVVAGNPAKVIMSLDDYHEKRKAAQQKEAEETVSEYRKVYGKDPDENVMSEFFWLFTDCPENLPPKWEYHMSLCGNRELSAKLMREHKISYKNIEDFFLHCKNQETDN